MSRETDFETRMEADAALMAILLGGVFTAGAVGREGISRDTTPSAFDTTTGFLLPCTLVRQRGNIPDNQVVDFIEGVASVAQVVEVWIYQDSGYSSIDTAKDRIYSLFQGYRFSDTFEIEMVNEIDRERDGGALSGASLARLDFIVYSIKGD